MGKRLRFAKYPETRDIDENLFLTCSEGYHKNDFDPKGIYSEEIFGSYNSEENDISRKGWIKLNHKLINPIIFLLLKKAKIVNFDNLLDFIDILDSEDCENFLKDHSKKDNKLIVELLLENKDRIVIDKIPVFSHKLRPVTVLGNNLVVTDKINTVFQFLIEYNNKLIDEDDDEKCFDKENFIVAMQQKLVEMINFIIEKLKGKTGILRKEIFAAKLNFIGRNVITPLVGDFKIDDISIPYITALELYRFQIINILSRIKKINYNEANKIWIKAQTFLDQEVYGIMLTLLRKTKGGLKVLLNRNPKCGQYSRNIILNLL